MPEIIVDAAALRDAARELSSRASELDAAGRRAPVGGDYGSAALLVTTALAVHTEAAARIATECAALATAVDLCRDDMDVTDAAQAIELLTVDEG